MKALKLTTKKTETAKERLDRATQDAKRVRNSAPETVARCKETEGKARAAYGDAVKGLREPVEDALKAVNGRASSFTLTLYSEVMHVVKEVEDKLSARGVSKSAMTGVTATYKPAGPSANAYKYSAKSTIITVKRVADGWRLVDVAETQVYPRENGKLSIVLTEKARDAVLRHAFDGMVAPEKETA